MHIKSGPDESRNEHQGEWRDEQYVENPPPGSTVTPKIRSEPMKEQGEQEGRSAEQEACVKPTCRPDPRCGLHLMSVPEPELGLRSQREAGISNRPPARRRHALRGL